MAVETERRAVSEKLHGDAEKATDAVRHWMEEAVRAMSGYADPALATEARAIVSRMSEDTTEDIRAIMTSYTIAASRLQDVQRAWTEWVQKSMNLTAQASNRLLQCRDLKQIAEVQRDFVEQSLTGLLQSSGEVLRLSTRATEDAVEPIEQRMTPARRASASRSNAA